MLSTYRFEIAVSAFDNLRCCIDDMPCANRTDVNMQKVRRMEIFFMILCQCYYFANFLAFDRRFFRNGLQRYIFLQSQFVLFIYNK